jgi:methyl-accepting chemotaxis protein
MTKRLYLVAAGVFAAIVAMGLVGYLNSRSILSEQIEKSGNMAAQAAADNVSSWLRERETVVASAGRDAAYLWEKCSVTGAQQDSNVRRLKAEYASMGFLDVGFGFTDGGFVSGSGWIPPAGWDPRTRPWYKGGETASGNSPILTAPYLDDYTKQTIVTFGMPVRGADGSLLGVLNADLSLNDLVKLVTGQRILGAGYGILATEDGTIIAHPGKDMTMRENVTRASAAIPRAMAEAGTRMIRGESGSTTFEDGEGRTLYSFYRPLPHGWSLMLLVHQKDLTGPIRAMGMRQLLTGGAALIALGLLILSMIRALMIPVRRLLQVSEAVSKGDLSRTADMTGSDELSLLGQGLDGVIRAQREVLIKLRDEGENMGEQARRLDELASKTESTLSAVGDRSRDLTRTADDNAQAVEAMTAGIEEVASSAQGAAQAAAEASSYAESLKTNAEGAHGIVAATADRIADMARAFRKVSDAVAGLNDQAGQIDAIVSTISGIADQTNLLALNAAIEAARAGEAGRGFAVVAEEVRKLAEESNRAALSIGELARAILAGTGAAAEQGDSGVRLAESVEQETRGMRDRLGEVLGAVARIVDQIQNVAATSQEQSAGAQEMAASVDRIAKGSDEARRKSEAITESVTDLAESARTLAETSNRLDGFVQGFREHIRRYRLDEETGLPSLPVRS